MPRKANVKLAKTRARAKQLQRYGEVSGARRDDFPFRSDARLQCLQECRRPDPPSDPAHSLPPAHSQRHVHLGERA